MEPGFIAAAIVPMDAKAPVVALIVYMDTLPAALGVKLEVAT